MWKSKPQDDFVKTIKFGLGSGEAIRLANELWAASPLEKELLLGKLQAGNGIEFDNEERSQFGYPQHRL